MTKMSVYVRLLRMYGWMFTSDACNKLENDEDAFVLDLF